MILHVKKNCGNIISSLKKSITSNPKICNRKTKGLSKNKNPVCTEKSLEDKIKTVHDVFETLVRDDTKLANNLKLSSKERKQAYKKNTASDKSLDASDEFMTKTEPEHSHTSLRNEKTPAHHLISCQK